VTPNAIRYTFGDDDPAAERLRLVADAYRAVSANFLRRNVLAGVGVAIDLGCGPGFSTQLLRDVGRPRRLLGLDASASFVEWARRLVPDGEFAVHDAARTPLPGSPADVLYARLLLAHLPDPATVVRRWQQELGPGGVLLVEDLEDIDAPPGPLRAYDEVSAEMVRSGGGPMYAGRALAEWGGDCVEVRVPAGVAARIYLFNVERWLRERPPAIGRDRLEELHAGLGEVAEAGRGSVAWLVRQLAVPAA
jgi:trans-aconitate 2-methyltransferase